MSCLPSEPWEAFFQEALFLCSLFLLRGVPCCHCTGHGHGFRGIRRIAAVSNKLVPVMAVIYVLTVVSLILINLDNVPYFFSAVFKGPSLLKLFSGSFRYGSHAGREAWPYV